MEANSLKGNFLYSTGGTGAGDEHELYESGYSTIGVMGWAVAGTAPTITTTWVRLAVRPQLILDAIAEVTRQTWRKQAIPVMYTALVTNNLLEDLGDFERWPDGATVAPPGWTLAGAGSSIARETYNTNANGTPSGVYHPAITAGAGAVATFTFTVEAKYLPLIRGQSLTLQGWIEEAVAGDITIRVSHTNSANTATNKDTQGTYAGNWESIGGYTGSGVSISLPDPCTNLSVQARIALSAVSRLDDLMLYGPYISDYPLPSQTIGLEPIIWMEDGFRSKNFSYPLYFGADWEVRRRESAPSTTKYDSDMIHFKRPLPSGRHLRMATYQAPSVQTTATSNVDPNPTWLALAAAIQLIDQVGAGNANVKVEALKLKLAAMEATSEGNTLKGIPFVAVESR